MSLASSASKSNSFGVNESSASPSVTRRVRRSISSSPRGSRWAPRPVVAPADDRTNACHQLAETERLHHVVVGPELEEHDAIDFLGARGEHDDRDVRATAQRPAHIRAIAIGEAEIQEHELGHGRGERGGGRGDARDGETVTREPGDERFGDRVVVLDEEHVHRSMFTVRSIGT